MATFLKAQAASIIASVVDFIVYLVLVQVTAHTPAMVSRATAEGAMAGGIVNFIIGRNWVFKEGSKKVYVQAFRYVLVWIGSILLNTVGMYYITYHTTLNFAVSRVLVGVFIGVTYNYFLQKRFVFK